jgi:CDP-diacylglycerol--glycerol-3-phosphate 3-phosphatidyltransferase
VAHTFGPTALATPANAVTGVRLAAAPVLLTLVIVIGPASWFLVGAWVVLAGSDGVDGWLARRHGTTRSGAFLDPLADKFLALGALVGLVARREMSWIPVALIGAREVAMSVFRTYAGRRGVSVPARWSAKLKTAAQDLAILLAFVPSIGGRHDSVVGWVLWVAVVLTLSTGLEYAFDGRRLLAAGTPVPPATST